MHILQSRRALVLVTSAAVAAGIGLGVAPAAQAANGKVTIANTLPRWLGHASKSAVTPSAATTQTVRVYLKDLGVVRVDYANGFDGSGGLLYSVRTFNQDSSLTTTKGWDTVTGLGVPNPKLLAATPSAR